jgi:hypothetical protein
MISITIIKYCHTLYKMSNIGMSSAETPLEKLLKSYGYVLPRGTILELGPRPNMPNAPNIKHTLEQFLYLPRAHEHMDRPIISVGHASPAAEAAALAGAAETARLATARLADPTAWRQLALHRFEADLYNLESRQANEMQRRVQDQHGCTVFKGCKEGEFDLCAFENPRTGDVRAFKRPFIPIGAEDPFLVSRELTAASHAPDIVRGRILHRGVLQQDPLMHPAMLSAMSANPDSAARSGLASILARRLTDPPLPTSMRANAKAQFEKSILKEPPPSPFSKKGGKKRTGRARLRSRFQSRRR